MSMTILCVHSALPVCLPCIHAMIYLDIDMEINIYSRTDWFCLKETGDSANAVPPTKKLRTRVTRIWGDRRGQPNRSAMERPRPGRTAVMITVPPVPGKYAFGAAGNAEVFKDCYCRCL